MTLEETASRPVTPPPVMRPPEPNEVFGRFPTANGALVFAEQASALTDTRCGRSRADGSWWVRAEQTLSAAREIVDLCAGELYVRRGEMLVRDRGWGDGPGAGRSVPLTDLEPLALLQLIRAAGLRPAPPRPAPAVEVLLPGQQVGAVVRRALDLGLHGSFQRVTLAPLFEENTGSRTAYALALTADRGGEHIPESLLTALAEDPFLLVCRPAEPSLLVERGFTAPLSDRALAALAGEETWVLSAPPRGCARLIRQGDPSDASHLVSLGPAHRLGDLEDRDAWAEPPGHATAPEPRELALLQAPGRDAPVDAILLDTSDLPLLPALMAGDPLAETAYLAIGKDRHLLAAPGGLLTELPLGTPVTCVGPGMLYLPVGYRTDPQLPASARGALFPPDPTVARVLLPGAVLVFDLLSPEPVWSRWAGAPPEVDQRLSRTARTSLARLEEEIGRLHSHEPPRGRRLWPRTGRGTAPVEQGWRQEALRAELEGDLTGAAQLYARHNEHLRAARLYERHAQESR